MKPNDLHNLPSLGALRRDSLDPVYYDRADFIRRQTSNLRKDYRVEATPFGIGTFGSVHRTIHKLTLQARAVKRLPVAAPADLEELRAEVNYMKTLDHPNIIKLHEYYESKKNFSVVMELCRGGELFDRICEHGLTEAEAVQTLDQILRAIATAHTSKIVHRDLKPENFLFQRAERYSRLKTIDFGLSAKMGDPMVDLKEPAGSVFYMSPEMLFGEHCEKTDAWSIGVILFIMLVGYPPFSNDQFVAMEMIRDGQYEMDPDDWAGISEEAKNVVRGLMSLDVAKRMSVSEALSHPFLNSQPPKQTPILTPMDVVRRFRLFRSRKRFQRIVLGIIAHMLLEDSLVVQRDTFMHLDIDKDGRLSIEDLKTAFARDRHIFDNEELLRLLRAVDVNNSGYVEYTEFIAATIDFDTHNKESLFYAAFVTLDHQDTGVLTREQLSEVLNRTIQEQTLRDYESMILEVDDDGDGQIHYRNFLDSMGDLRRRSLRGSICFKPVPQKQRMRRFSHDEPIAPAHKQNAPY
eukprot:Filipodium_phascolosomae@DN1546_c0_g1_i1.p1